MSSHLRSPAVAGLFYPEDAAALAASVRRLLAAVAPEPGPRPQAIIAPHAGYVYSGPIAASAYALLEPFRDAIERVVLLGPSHYVPLRGLATSSAMAFETPLGRIPVDVELRDRLLQLPQVVSLDAAHAREHSLEVHLPFLQTVLASFSLVPLAVGDATATEVAAVLEPTWNDDGGLVVVSSDLSHYLDYETAQRIDKDTCYRIENLARGGVSTESACGSRAVNGLIEAARRQGLEPSTLDLRNSGDTAGPRDRVVGYGSWAFFSREESTGRADRVGA